VFLFIFMCFVAQKENKSLTEFFFFFSEWVDRYGYQKIRNLMLILKKLPLQPNASKNSFGL
jgi:hypothetical protein